MQRQEYFVDEGVHAFDDLIVAQHVALDAIGYAANTGRREGIIDTYAPWLYCVTQKEIQKEGDVDRSKVVGLDQYLYVDVYADDVGGSGDQTCAPLGVYVDDDDSSCTNGVNRDGPNGPAPCEGSAYDLPLP